MSPHFGARRVLCLLLLLVGLCLAQDTVETETLESGMGPPIKKGQTAIVSYRLTLDDGKVVDSRGTVDPLVFEVGSPKYLPGFSLAVEGMKVGEKREAIIPPHLGYGAREAGEIPANATLHFQIELLRIKNAPSESETHYDGDGHDEHHPAHLEMNDHHHEEHHFEGDGHDHGSGHFEGDGHDHGDEDLSQRFEDQDFLKNRNAREISRPAIFEFLIRDFFTKPWRYADGHVKIWHSVRHLVVVLLLLTLIGAVGRRRGYWS